MLSQTTLVPCVQILEALSGILDKAEAHAAQRKIEPETLLFARLFPDMFHFTRQVQTTCDFAMKVAARLSERQPEKMDLSERSFAEVKALVARATDYVRETDAAKVDASANAPVTFFINSKPVTMTGVAYAHRFAMPNFYFHATTAYAILRENGVDVGKIDFMGKIKD